MLKRNKLLVGHIYGYKRVPHYGETKTNGSISFAFLDINRNAVSSDVYVFIGTIFFIQARQNA